jgi:hypothetical protein
MIERIWSYFSYENEALIITAMVILFCGAVILGIM